MITSLQNKRIKEWKKLHRRKTRHEKKQFLIEGFHLVEEAIKSEALIEEIILEEGLKIPEEWHISNITEVNRAVIKHLSQTETPQGIMAVVRMKSEQRRWNPHILMLDAIQDPGNVGTMLRTADAAGFHTVVLGEGTVDVYNEKVIRASQGSIFHISIIQADFIPYVKKIKQQGYQIVTTDTEHSAPYYTVQPPEKMALIVGNEGSGIHEDVVYEGDIHVHIPIYGEAESLNVSIAAGILMYHFTLLN